MLWSVPKLGWLLDAKGAVDAIPCVVYMGCSKAAATGGWYRALGLAASLSFSWGLLKHHCWFDDPPLDGHTGFDSYGLS